MTEHEEASRFAEGRPEGEEWGRRAVVVTGAAGGIGGGIVKALLEKGAFVVLSDAAAAHPEAVASSLDPSGRRVSAFPADVCDDAQVDALAEHALERFGNLYSWVNNAGVVELGPALETSRSALVHEFEVNVVGLLRCCQAAARAIGRGALGGSIVNVASNAGKVGFPDMVGYNASKAAVINLTRNLAEEWAPSGINVNAVCPGSVRTAMLRRVAEHVAGKNGLPVDEVLGSFVSRQLRRAIEPVEVGRVVVFLLSEAARVIRGQAINVDGGETPY